jgi:F-type H+-transporting ATPase subunit gamma
VSKSREVKRRIRSVENTRQITRTMEMVATSKLKRATDRVYAARPYSEALEEIVRSLYNPGLADRFPLLRTPDTPQAGAAVLLLTANRGLAGAFNVNLIRKARALLDELRTAGVETELHVVGKKGIGFFRFLGDPFPGADGHRGQPSPEEAESLVAPLRERFARGELDRVTLVASEFRSALSTPPARQLLPIAPGGVRRIPRTSS